MDTPYYNPFSLFIPCSLLHKQASEVPSLILASPSHSFALLLNTYKT